MIQPSTLQFLNELKDNNNKDWFDIHRKIYQVAKTDVEQFADGIINALSHHDATLSMLTGKGSMFRINRDIRFSTDKSPYKTNMGFWMNKGGKKSPTAGYYVHIEPNNKSFIAAGIYMPMPPDLKKVRTEILYNFDTFQSLINDAAFQAAFGGLEVNPAHKVSRVPQGFDATHPSAEWLKLKSFIATRPLTDQQLSTKGITAEIVAQMSTAIPLVHFINTAFEIVED